MITRRLALSVPLSLTATLSLASCSKDPAGTAATPTVMKPEDLAGGVTVTITPTQSLQIDVDEPSAWSGSTDGTSIATFSAAGKKTKPAFKGVAPGTVNATLTGPNGVTYQFTLTVVADGGSSQSGAQASVSAS